MGFFDALRGGGNQLGGATGANSGGLFAGLDPTARSRVMQQVLLQLGSSLLGNAGTQGAGAIGPALGQGAQSLIGGVENERDRALQQEQVGMRREGLELDKKALAMRERQEQAEIAERHRIAEALIADQKMLSQTVAKFRNQYSGDPAVQALLDEGEFAAAQGDADGVAESIRRLNNHVLAIKKPDARVTSQGLFERKGDKWIRVPGTAPEPPNRKLRGEENGYAYEIDFATNEAQFVPLPQGEAGEDELPSTSEVIQAAKALTALESSTEIPDGSPLKDMLKKTLSGIINAKDSAAAAEADPFAEVPAEVLLSMRSMSPEEQAATLQQYLTPEEVAELGLDVPVPGIPGADKTPPPPPEPDAPLGAPTAGPLPTEEPRSLMDALVARNPEAKGQRISEMLAAFYKKNSPEYFAAMERYRELTKGRGIDISGITDRVESRTRGGSGGRRVGMGRR